MVVYTKLGGGEFFFDDELEGCQLRLRFARDMQKVRSQEQAESFLTHCLLFASLGLVFWECLLSSLSQYCQFKS